VAGTYNYWLVALSLVVASFASYAALDLATRLTAARGRPARYWLIGGAFSMGTGIWSMHFIGMLAFSLPVPMGYDVPVTLLSMLIAIVVSGFALHTVSRESMGPRHLLLGAVLMGLGICAMHYTGMAAMDTHPPIRYDPLLFAASVLIAIIASLAALWMAFTLREDLKWMAYAKLGSAVIMGLAITGMHYTGMAAANFAADTICLAGALVDNSWMAGTIAAVTVIILVGTLLLSVFDARAAMQAAHMAKSLQAANEELRHMALHDALTRLPNRLLVEDRIGQALAHARRTGDSCAVLFVDLDRFKNVNDSLGHFAGDELLRAVAARLLEVVRSEDTVSRLGGDEFVILLKELGAPEDAAAVAAKVVEALKRPFHILNREIFITPSVGISIFPQHGEEAQALISSADAAMYSAKRAGRNNIQLSTANGAQRVPKRLELESELRRALERGEFVLHYQPKIDLYTGALCGAEALLRWQHPQRGTVAPGDFIPLAEETGLIIPLGAWVLREACRQSRDWRDRSLPKMRVAVNLSAAQFRQKGLLDSVRDALSASDVPPECLELEITESMVMHNAPEAACVLEALSVMGVHVSIDDFGTGYSSLSYLKRFPIQSLKIDRSFVRDVSVDPGDAAIVRAIIAIAHQLGLKVVAEGVETESQLQILRGLGGDQYQGFYCSRPLSAEAFEAFILARQSSRPRPLLAPA
jgi:diguanylate cyclase (GGDEF)-like protein